MRSGTGDHGLIMRLLPRFDDRREGHKIAKRVIVAVEVSKICDRAEMRAQLPSQGCPLVSRPGAAAVGTVSGSDGRAQNVVRHVLQLHPSGATGLVCTAATNDTSPPVVGFTLRCP